jgi:hypothetical protein
LGSIIVKFLIVLIVLSCSRSLSDRREVEEVSFNSDIWNSDSSLKFDDNLITLRHRMITDLVDVVLLNKNKVQVIELLGHGLATPYFKSLNYDLIYNLGPSLDLYSIDEDWLLIWFDKDGIFMRYEIRTD